MEKMLESQRQFPETVKELKPKARSEDHLAQKFRIQPTVKWERLDDNTHGPAAAEDYFKQFESLCCLANTGKGMRKAEMLIALHQTFGGSRKTIFENVVEESGEEGDNTLGDDPASAYRETKRRLSKKRYRSVSSECKTNGSTLSRQEI